MINPMMQRMIAEALEGPNTTVEVYAGMKEVSAPGSSSVEFEPTGGKTYVIAVNGGANNVRVERIETEDDERRRHAIEGEGSGKRTRR